MGAAAAAAAASPAAAADAAANAAALVAPTALHRPWASLDGSPLEQAAPATARSATSTGSEGGQQRSLASARLVDAAISHVFDGAASGAGALAASDAVAAAPEPAQDLRDRDFAEIGGVVPGVEIGQRQFRIEIGVGDDPA